MRATTILPLPADFNECMVENIDYKALAAEAGYPIEHLAGTYPVTSSTISEYTLRFILYILHKIEGFFGVTLLFAPPYPVAQLGEVARPALRTYAQLTDLGIAESLSFDQGIYPDEPPLPRCVVVPKGIRRFGYLGVGTDLSNTSNALWPAVGEALERWALHNTHFDLADKTVEPYTPNADMVNIKMVVGFSPEQQTNESELTRTDDTKFSWVNAVSIFDDRVVRAPLQWFSFTYASYERQLIGEPLLSPILSTGAAVANTYIQAVTKGILEIIERDAFMIYWLRGIKPAVIEYRSATDERLRKIAAYEKAYNLKIHFSYLQSDAPAHIIACTIIDKTSKGPAVSVNTAAGFSVVDTLVHAFTGTLMIRNTVREAKSKTAVPVDASNIGVSFEQRGLYWSDVERIDDVRFLYDGEAIQLTELPNYTANDIHTLEIYLSELGYEAVYKSIIPEDLSKQVGLKAVMVRIPQMQPLFIDQDMSATYGERLRTVPQKLGLECTSEVNPVPHPFL